MTAVEWMRSGGALFFASLESLGDEELNAHTALPGWTRRHLVAHVHYNAEALRRLVTWARTSRETAMYADRAQRNAEIEQGALLPAHELRELAKESHHMLDVELAALDQDQWRHEVVTIQGRTIPAADIPWLRAREISVHAVDLGAGVTFSDLSEEFSAALVADVVTKRAAGGEAAALAGWLTGRVPDAPALGPWL